MKRVSGLWNGTGADIYICIGFVPDEVLIRNLENAEDYLFRWDRHMMRSGERTQGVLRLGDDDADFDITPMIHTSNEGLEPYYGGDTLTSSEQTDTTYGGGVYLIRDGDPGAYEYDSVGNDYRAAGTGDAIDTWTLGNTTNHTGNWNDVCNTTYVGEGSRIWIGDEVSQTMEEYAVIALTGNGESANEVTLDRPASSGKIFKLSGMYDFVPMAIGKITPAGFKYMDETVNANDEMCYFIATKWDD